MVTSENLFLLPKPRRIASRPGTCPTQTPPHVVIDPRCGIAAQGYRLRIAPEGTLITAADDAGTFYAKMTLRQIARQCGGTLPALEIDDWPDFPSRGVLLYISNLRVPTMDALFALVDQLAEWKINRLELATEFSFAYRDHRQVWERLDPMTDEETLALDAYCRERFVELVPCQQTFGHLEWWLKWPQYKHLAEVPEDGFSLCPTDPAAAKFMEGLLDEYLPLHTSKKVNIQCDETVDIGKGRSRGAVERLGEGRVYLDFVRAICEVVWKHGRTPHIFADIVFKHPELLPDLPRPCVMLDWGYEWNSPFEEHCRKLAEAVLPFEVYPSASVQQSCVGRTENGLLNRRSAAKHGLAHGATGYVITEWCVEGNWHYLSQALLGFADGAAVSWCYATNHDADLPAALHLHVFQDEARQMGRIAFDLGNAYLRVGHQIENGSMFWVPLYYPPDNPEIHKLRVADLRAAREYVDGVWSAMPRVRMRRPDAQIVADEFANCVRQVRLGIDLAIATIEGTRDKPEMRRALPDRVREVIAEHRRLALMRNRPGGLEQTLAPLKDRLKELS
jgi:hexosaminidase